MRTFTCDTIPFTVTDSLDPTKRLNLQELLVDPYLVLKHPFEETKGYSHKQQLEAEDELSKASLMASVQD